MPAIFTDYDKKIIARLKEAYTAAFVRFQKSHTTKAIGVCPAYNMKDKATGRTIWEKILIYARRNRVSPFALLCMTFETWHNHREAPRPHHMLASYVLPQLDRFAAEKLAEVRICFNADKAKFSTEMTWLLSENKTAKHPQTEMRLYTEVLANDYLQISPLFRYSTARQLKLQSVIDATREAADNQFAEFPPAYLSVWGDLLSNRHRVTMARIYACEEA